MFWVAFGLLQFGRGLAGDEWFQLGLGVLFLVVAGLGFMDVRQRRAKGLGPPWPGASRHRDDSR